MHLEIMARRWKKNVLCKKIKEFEYANISVMRFPEK